jgi:5'/3'-nucleotidase
MPNILLTNNEYQAEGLRAVAEALADFATVSIVAPSREQSGTAQSLTVREPILCDRLNEGKDPRGRSYSP